MSPVKQQVLDMVQSLPEDVTLDDILAEIYFKAQWKRVSPYIITFCI
jgi:hypothetical protein